MPSFIHHLQKTYIRGSWTASSSMIAGSLLQCGLLVLVLQFCSIQAGYYFGEGPISTSVVAQQIYELFLVT